MGRIFDVGVSFHLWLVTKQTQIPVRNGVLIKPRHSVTDRHLVTPVGVKTVGNQSDPNPGIRQVPQRFSHPRHGRHRAEHPVVKHRLFMQPQKGCVVDTPRVVVPRHLRPKGGGVHTQFCCHHFTERSRVVTTHPIEVNAKDKRTARDTRHADKPTEACKVPGVSATQQPQWVASRHGDPADVLEFTTGPVPQPGPGQALVEVRAAGVNFADGLQCEGTYQHPAEPPFTPGLEVAGVVVGGDPPAGCGIGDPIVGTTTAPWGSWAHYAIVSTADAYPAGPHPDFVAHAASHIVFQTAHVALVHRAQLHVGDTVVVQGAGGATGSAAVQVAATRGANVIAVAGGADKCSAAVRCGASVALDHRTDDVVASVLELTDGKGADVAYDPVGAATLATSRKCLGFGGRLVVVGFASGGEPPMIAANHVLVRNLDVIGVAWPAWRTHAPGVVTDVQNHINTCLADGTYQPLVAGVRPLDDAAAALADLRAGVTIGKWVLTPQPH